jgi:hypothetical protein
MQVAGTAIVGKAKSRRKDPMMANNILKLFTDTLSKLIKAISRINNPRLLHLSSSSLCFAYYYVLLNFRTMAEKSFSTECYLEAMIRFRDIIKYKDADCNPEERIRNLHYAYSKYICRI